MPGLVQSLQGQDLGHMRIVAQFWGLNLRAGSIDEAVQELEAQLPAAVAAGWEELPQPVREAALALTGREARYPWAQFVRLYGELRQLGPGRRDKEQPHLHPISVTEQLWYRGLLGRAFFDSPDGLVEFAYVPDDLLAVLPLQRGSQQAFGRPARPEERATEFPATDIVVDQACTLLAGLRSGVSAEQLATAEDWKLPIANLKTLLASAGLVDDKNKPIPDAARKFLEVPRSQALAQLAQAWLVSESYNELRMLPELQAEGAWENEPKPARQQVLSFARSAPTHQWWHLGALTADVKSRRPDFQRPNGDYESWYLRGADGGYLRGFEHWEEVEGALIPHIFRGPMHALGFVDLAAAAKDQLASAFRWSRWAGALLKGKAPTGLAQENQKLRVDSRGKIVVPALAPRAARYLVARFCTWLPRQKDGYVYLITARSLEQARKQGLKVSQLLALLKTNSSAALPPNLLQALKRWEQQGAQVRLGQVLVLRVSSAAALKALRASKAARYLGEPLGPTAIAIKDGAAQQVLGALLELGYLGDVEEVTE